MVIVGSEEEERRFLESFPPQLPIRLSWILVLAAIIIPYCMGSEQQKGKATAAYVVHIQQDRQGGWHEKAVWDTLLNYNPQHVDSDLVEKILEDYRPKLRENVKRHFTHLRSPNKYRDFLVYYRTVGEETEANPVNLISVKDQSEKDLFKRVADQYVRNQ